MYDAGMCKKKPRKEETSAVSILTRNSNLKETTASPDGNANTLSVMSRRMVSKQRNTEDGLRVVLGHILALFLGGALSAVRAQCNYLGVWPY